MHLDARLIGSPQDSKNVRLYRRMCFIRCFEENLLKLFDEGILNGTTHACIGQEADCVGVLENVQKGDHIFSNHRCHGHYLALTGDAVGLLAEVMGKDSGVCGGIGGSQNICAPNFKSSGILGGTVPTAAGIALGMKFDDLGAISIVFLGDGTMGEGIVYETLNMAKLWKIPLFIVVENNCWSQSTPITMNFAGSMVTRFEAFDIPVTEVTTTDVLEIRDVAKEEFDVLRSEGGPRAMIINTYRLCHHSRNDDNRPKYEVEKRWDLEPLGIQAKRIKQAKVDIINAEVQDAIEDLTAKVRSLP